MAEVRELNEQRRHSLPELIRDLSNETSTLVRQEVELAKLELTEKATALGLGAGLLAAAAVIVLFAFGALTAAIVAALALALQTWLAALIVGVAYLVLAAVLGWWGWVKLRNNAPPVPEETVETVREDVLWLRQKRKSVTK